MLIVPIVMEYGAAPDARRKTPSFSPGRACCHGGCPGRTGPSSQGRAQALPLGAWAQKKWRRRPAKQHRPNPLTKRKDA